MLNRIRALSDSNNSAYAVLIVVAAIHAFFLFGTAILLSFNDSSIAQVVTKQDAAEFFSLGQSLIGDGNFYVHGIHIPETFRTIGYPAVIALIFGLTGGSTYVPTLSDPSWGDSFYIVIGFLSLLLILTSGVVSGIAQKLGMPRIVSIGAGVLTGISPAALLLPLTGMGSDVIFVFLLALSLYLLLSFEESRNPYIVASGIGILMGFATITRPVGQFFSVTLIAAILFFTDSPRLFSRKAMLCTAVGAIMFGSMVAPWVVRNYHVGGHAAVSSIPVYSFANYNIPGFMLFYYGIAEGETQKRILDRIGNPPDKVYRSFAYSDALAEINAEFLGEHLLPYAFFHALKTIPFFLGSGLDVLHATLAIETNWTLHIPFFPHVDDNLSTLVFQGNIYAVFMNLVSYWPATLERLVWAMLFLGMMIAPFTIDSGRARRFSLLAIVLVGLGAILASPVAQPRYRVPVEPLIWTMGLYGMLEVARYARPMYRRIRLSVSRLRP